MTRAQYQALCIIGGIAVFALLQALAVKRAMRGTAPLYTPPKTFTA